MRNFLKNFCCLAALTGILFACNPTEPVAQIPTGNSALEANFKGAGTAFYTIDGKSGQLSYMINFGEDAGNWRKFGNPYRSTGATKLHFKATERSIGTSFYILNGGTGQMSYMLDYGEGAGTWTGFGNPLKTVTVTEFEVNATADGMVFYAYDGVAKQLYFMQDFGEKAGNWIPFGKDEN